MVPVPDLVRAMVVDLARGLGARFCKRGQSGKFRLRADPLIEVCVFLRTHDLLKGK